jgi:uncharacterized protein YhfF
MDRRRSPAVEAYWRGYARSRGLGDDYDVVAFGDSPGLAEALAALVLCGRKRATACLLRDVEAGGESMAQVDGHVVLLDGSGNPCAIWRTTHVEVKPLNQVDAAFAWDEGEGDRSRENWLAGHTGYFRGQAQRQGFAFSDDIATVFERFEIVWPPHAADRP